MRYRPLLLLAAASAALAGCVQDTNTNANAPVNTPGNSTSSKPVGPPPFTAKKGASDPLKIAVVPKGTTHQFWQTVHAGAEAAGKEMNSEILWNGPKAETDIQDQIEIIRNYANQGVDGIAMAATDKSALASVVDEIQGKPFGSLAVFARGAREQLNAAVAHLRGAGVHVDQVNGALPGGLAGGFSHVQ